MYRKSALPTLTLVLAAFAAEAYDPMPDPRMTPRDEDSGAVRYQTYERSARAKWLDTQSNNVRGHSKRNKDAELRDGVSRDSRAWR